MIKKSLLVLSLPVIALVLSGCTRGSGSGVFYSLDAGQTFSAATKLNEKETLEGRQIFALTVHPSRPAVIFGSLDNGGLIISHDSGNTWSGTALTTGSPSDIAIHPQAVTTVFVASGQQVVRTDNDGQSFSTLYADPGQVTALAIDPAAPQNIWIGTDQGSVVHSTNAGKTWQVATTFRRAVSDILISPLGSAIVIGTRGDGLYISGDRGATFVVRTPTDSQVPQLTIPADDTISIAQTSTAGSPLVLATTAGLLSSTDLGKHWNLLDNPVASAGTLSGLSASSGATPLLVAVAGNTIATSSDGGATWATRSVDNERALGPIAVVGKTIVVGAIGKGKGFVERSLQQ